MAQANLSANGLRYKRIVVIGGGFAGLAAAKDLARKKLPDGEAFEITLVDRRNHHLFQPLLYQVATAALSPAEISVPIRSLFANSQNVRVVLDEVKDFQLSPEKTVICRSGRAYPFDVLILAAGAGHSYFGHDEWQEFAPGLKTLDQATNIRKRILLAYERAEMETDVEKQKALLTFAIVGGGPTGVEIAGAIAEISRFTLESDFRRIDPSRTRVLLIEAGGRLLSSFHESLSKKATRDLEKMGVQIWTSTRVTGVSAEGVQLGQEFVQASTVIWAAGVKPSPLGEKVIRTFGGSLDQVGRVKVDSHLQLLGGDPNVLVLGDLASFKDENGNSLPGLAPVAMQQGRYAAKLILEKINLKPSQAPAPFHYFDKGQMATIGRRRAVVQAGRLRFSGYLAWLTWLFIHIYYLIGFKNRFFVFYQWAWAYLTFRRGARLIQES
ncbi:MAG: NAD(P)/FAD-dependent oxidoreductase [Deltaproteobacteria bacterium]|nr:NAD(P)/FAD-dependent oxidoreductase [Deltaproteobacteria bacterium]